MMYRATSDTSYLYKANDERAENINLMEIKFLKRKNSLEGGNENYIYYFYSADVVNGDSTDTVYLHLYFHRYIYHMMENFRLLLMTIRHHIHAVPIIINCMRNV